MAFRFPFFNTDQTPTYYKRSATPTRVDKCAIKFNDPSVSKLLTLIEQLRDKSDQLQRDVKISGAGEPDFLKGDQVLDLLNKFDGLVGDFNRTDTHQNENEELADLLKLGKNLLIPIQEILD